MDNDSSFLISPGVADVYSAAPGGGAVKVWAMYSWSKVWAQLRVVVPISAYLALIQLALFQASGGAKEPRARPRCFPLSDVCSCFRRSFPLELE